MAKKVEQGDKRLPVFVGLAIDQLAWSEDGCRAPKGHIGLFFDHKVKEKREERIERICHSLNVSMTQRSQWVREKLVIPILVVVVGGLLVALCTDILQR